jgi:hypothetical protein
MPTEIAMTSQVINTHIHSLIPAPRFPGSPIGDDDVEPDVIDPGLGNPDVNDPDIDTPDVEDPGVDQPDLDDPDAIPQVS